MRMQAPNETRSRPAPLAASMTLLCSGWTLAEPGEPVVDWIEPEYVIGESADSVQVPVAWTRHYGAPALTAQYWLNDELVLTRAVDAGEQDGQSGSATLTIDAGGEHQVSVALCDAAGCTASEPMPITVVDPEHPLALSPSEHAEQAMPSFEEAARTVRAIAAQLAEAPADPVQSAAGANQTWGGWFASFVGQAALKYGLTMGFDALLEQVGLNANGPDLAAEFASINQSLAELKVQLDEISRKIDVGKADSDFKNSHREADVAMQNIMSIAGYIAAAEAGTALPTEQQLQQWALANSTNLSALRSLLVNPLTGAVPLLLDYYQIKYPVSSGIEVRDEVDGYLDGFRAALGVALINQAWLSDQFAPNALYDAQAEADARATVETAYDLTGAPYPQPSNGSVHFVHRIGTDWALIDEARPAIGGEKARVMTQARDKVWDVYSSVAAGVNAPGDLTIADYMDENQIKRGFDDPNSVRIDTLKDLFKCEIWVRYDSLGIVGNERRGWDTVTSWHWKVNNACGVVTTDPWARARDEEARLKSDLSANQKVFTVNVPTNAWGMPALMDERSIVGYRDGIDVTSVVRGVGNAVTVEYARNGYDRLQLHDPETGDLLYSMGLGTAWNTTISQLPVPSGALELRLGHGVGDQRDANMVVRERAIIAANPGYATVELSLRPH